jgi:predicted LPLAT superfamily acyltransferase
VSEGAGWEHVRERGSVFALRLVVGFYRIFGRPLSMLLVHAIALYYFLTFATARRASLAYLRRVARTPEGAAALGRRPGLVASFLHIRAFALSIFDRLTLWLGDDGDFSFEVHGLEQYDRLLRPDRGALVVGAHLGSFDALRALADRDGRVVNVLMFTRHAPRINAVFRQLSPRAQVRVIAASEDALETVLRIRACISRGEIVAMLGDRAEPRDAGRTCRVPLLGGSVDLPEAPYLLAGLLGCPLFFMVALRARRGRYRVFAEVLAERLELPRDEREKRIRELAATYAARLEHYCIAAPYEWFNFYDYWQEGLRAPSRRGGSGDRLGPRLRR